MYPFPPQTARDPLRGWLLLRKSRGGYKVTVHKKQRPRSGGNSPESLVIIEIFALN